MARPADHAAMAHAARAARDGGCPCDARSLLRRLLRTRLRRAELRCTLRAGQQAKTCSASAGATMSRAIRFASASPSSKK